MSSIWLEKHRPETLDRMVGNAAIISKLKSLAREQNIMSMILSGPPGCGKTTAILALARTVLGTNFGVAAIELNASDERGIDVVRDRIKEFAEKKVTLPAGQHKVVILDEADSLTESAQQALRMIISDFSDSTRFVFSCNDSSKIIEPIQSRCVVLRFTRLKDEEVAEFLGEVCRAERLNVESSGLETLVFVAEGDLRNAVNNLQAVATAAGVVSRDSVMSVCDVPKLELIRHLFLAAAAGSLEEALGHFHALWAENYCVHDLVAYMGRMVEKIEELDFETKFKFMGAMAELKVRDSMGLGTKTQIAGTIAELVTLATSRK